MSERIKSFNRFLNNGDRYPCNVFTSLIIECPEQLLQCITSVDNTVSLKDRILCNCFAETVVDCDCLPMPLLNHFVYIISSFTRHFDLAKLIIEALIDRGCDVNKLDTDIGSVLHAIICCIDNDIRLNATPREYQLSIQCLDYLLSLNLCDLNLDIGNNRFCNAKGTPLAMAIERELVSVVRKLIGVGVSVTKAILYPWILPISLSNETTIQMFDLLIEAGIHQNPHFKAHINSSINGKYKNWIQSKNFVPLKLKSLARIAIREKLQNRINDKNLIQQISIPKSLIVYLKFEDNIISEYNDFPLIKAVYNL